MIIMNYKLSFFEREREREREKHVVIKSPKGGLRQSEKSDMLNDYAEVDLRG